LTAFATNTTPTMNTSQVMRNANARDRRNSPTRRAVTPTRATSGQLQTTMYESTASGPAPFPIAAPYPTTNTSRKAIRL
jgi:hypothetical protein